MTPAEKWREACKMRETAWELKTAFVKSQRPDWSEEQVRKAVRDIFLYAAT